jgi:hypothetical protein
VIVLILVAVLWIAVLVPSVISKLSERRSAGSIDHFHQRLDLLERTGPKLVSPAYRLTGTESVASSGPVLVVAAPPPPVRPNLVLVPPAGAAPLPDASAHEPASPPVASQVVVRMPAATADVTSLDAVAPSLAQELKQVARDRRSMARRRRRDVFGTLCALAALSGLLGLAHPLRGAWIASAVFLTLLTAFVGLAMYGQRIEAERRHIRELQRVRQREEKSDDLDSGVVKFLSEGDLAHYYEVEDARLVAQG